MFRVLSDAWSFLPVTLALSLVILFPKKALSEQTASASRVLTVPCKIVEGAAGVVIVSLMNI